MRIQLQFWPTLTVAVVMLSWFGGLIVFLSRKKPRVAGTKETKRERSYIGGIVLQGIGFWITWVVRRRQFTPIVPLPLPVEIVFSIVTMALAIGSAWLVLSAMQTLGKQWAFAARVVEGHKLVTDGPYRIVRNPIYAGLFGMMLATGLA